MIYSLQAFRGLFAVLIFAFHCIASAGISGTPLDIFYPSGRGGVVFFFILSGFVLERSFRAKGLRGGRLHSSEATTRAVLPP